MGGGAQDGIARPPSVAWAWREGGDHGARREGSGRSAFLPGSQPVTRLDLGAGRRGRRGHAMPAHAPDAHDSSVRTAGGVPTWGRRVHARVPRGVTLPRVRGWRRPPAGSHAGSHPDTPPLTPAGGQHRVLPLQERLPRAGPHDPDLPGEPHVERRADRVCP